ncbi:peptidoglycan-binding LysM domain protein [Pholiota molesta]|nr:peptidoglycan-binding LysM domain protein [Pholiota molesta]
MLTDDSDDLSYNPFAESQDDYSPTTGGSNLAQGYYSSAFFPKIPNSLPTLRHRRSSSTDYLYPKSNGEPKKHTRTRTEIQIVPPHSAGLHPLKSALARVDDSSLESLGITRPRLTQINPPSPEEEKDVIIHQVSPKDSLPGVALKYGISLPNLRRANQLWPADSIHHRAVLYIPIDQASRAREHIPELNLITLSPDPQDETASIVSQATSASPLSRGNAGSVPPSPSAPVRKIPAKQLSYFPPSTHKTIDSPASLGETNITSHILTGGDEIITRLSFDSVSSSFSDRSRINSDEDDGHELNEVKRPNPISVDESESEDGSTLPTPKASQRNSHAMRSRDGFSSSSTSKSAHGGTHTSASPPQFYVSQAHETYVRTSQLEPSPAMNCPISLSLQTNSTLERTSSLTLGRKSKIQPPDDIGLTLDNLTTNAPR